MRWRGRSFGSRTCCCRNATIAHPGGSKPRLGGMARMRQCNDASVKRGPRLVSEVLGSDPVAAAVSSAAERPGYRKSPRRLLIAHCLTDAQGQPTWPPRSKRGIRRLERRPRHQRRGRIAENERKPTIDQRQLLQTLPAAATATGKTACPRRPGARAYSPVPAPVPGLRPALRPRGGAQGAAQPRPIAKPAGHGSAPAMTLPGRAGSGSRGARRRDRSGPVRPARPSSRGVR